MLFNFDISLLIKIVFIAGKAP